jgi:hypothetical protein
MNPTADYMDMTIDPFDLDTDRLYDKKLSRNQHSALDVSGADVTIDNLKEDGFRSDEEDEG